MQGIETPRDAAIRSELHGELNLALGKVHNSLRIPIVLRYLQGLSYAEAAEVMDLSADTVRKRVKKGLALLKKLLIVRGLAVPVVAIEAGLRSIPVKAASPNFLTSASSIIQAATAGGIAGAGATAVLKGGLVMTAKSKIAIGVGAAIFLAGTITYFATKAPGRERAATPPGSTAEPPAKTQIVRAQPRVMAESPEGRGAEADEALRQREGLWGRVVDVQDRGIPDVKVEAGVFEGGSPISLTRKVLVRNTMTDSKGEFWFAEKGAFSGAIQILRRRAALPQKSPEVMHSLIIVSREGYCAARREVDFESVAGEQKLILREAPQISGRVIWKESKEPIAEEEVVCTPEQSDMYQVPKAETQTDQKGNFSLTIPAEGAAKLWAEFVNAFEPEPKQPNIVLVPGEKIRDFVLKIELLSDTILEGRVLDESRAPVAGAEVRLSAPYGGIGTMSVAAHSQEDGHYRLMVRRDWPYGSYGLKDWPERPRIFGWHMGPLGACAEPAEGSKRVLLDGKWDWVVYWTPPPNAPPERLTAFHPEYEIGVVEVPSLGPGQVHHDVDFVLYKGTRVSGRVLDDSSQPVTGAEIAINVKRIKSVKTTPAGEVVETPEEAGVLINNDLAYGFGKGEHWYQQQRKISSGEHGIFQVVFLREGVYELTATHEDCDPETKELELQPHQVVEGFDFVLVKKAGFIQGKVLDQNAKPWPHGKVTASGLRVLLGGSSAEVKEDGSYELLNLKPGNYNLWLDVPADYAEPQGVLQIAAPADVPTGTEGANIIVTVLPAGRLRVRVVDEAQQPIKLFHLQCYPLTLSYGSNGIVRGPLKVDEEKGHGNPYSYTRDSKNSGILLLRRDVVSESGEFVAERVAPGSYFVAVNADKRPEEFKEVKVEAGVETLATFELKSLGRLEGVVVDNEGRPQEGILVRAMKMKDVLNSTERVTILKLMVLDWEELYGRNNTRSGPDGRFVLEDLEQTEYRVTAEDGQGRSTFADVSIGGSGQASVKLVVTYGSSSIQGYVYGEDGSPVPRAEVVLEGSAHRSRARTDAQGYYAFSDLPPGRYVVKGQVGGQTSLHYRSREVELAEGEQATVDLVAWGEGEIEGSVSLAGDAARATAWFEAHIQHSVLADRDRRLILTELTDSGAPGGRELRLPVDETFELKNVPAGTYRAWAHYVVRVSPEPVPDSVSDSHFREKPCFVKFISEPQVVRVVPWTRAAVHLTISQACTSHYPIPDPVTCDSWLPVER
jgi:hypothetical protein